MGIISTVIAIIIGLSLYHGMIRWVSRNGAGSVATSLGGFAVLGVFVLIIAWGFLAIANHHTGDNPTAHAAIASNPGDSYGTCGGMVKCQPPAAHQSKP